ncbi:hypothetical protein, partial [Shigella sp. FC1967]|uniref:hypothetical protein n=1 Tax=Shigella sp. FC1967 TaxID=1898041 RepID=UPI002570D53E
LDYFPNIDATKLLLAVEFASILEIMGKSLKDVLTNFFVLINQITLFLFLSWRIDFQLKY